MSEVLIQLENVAVTRGERQILDNVSWTLSARQNWAVLGGNGAGKSTLLKVLRGDLWPDHTQGQRTYFFDGVPTFSPFRAKEKIALISFEHQAKYWRHEWNLTGRELLWTGFFGSELLHQKPPDDQQAQAEALAERLQITALLDKHFQQTSQGELRKFLIARALLTNPQILMLDEFCAGLDAFSRRALLDFTETLAHSGIQLICSTHRKEEVSTSLQNVLILNEGRATPMQRSEWEEKSLHRLRGHSPLPAFPPSRLPVEDSPQTFLIRVRHANVILEEKPILHYIDWEMKPGEHWAILGANGSGKSTFLKMLIGDLWPARGGHVHRFGKETFEGLWKLKEKIGFLSHEFQAKYHEHVTAREAVYSGFFHSVGMGLISRMDVKQKARTQQLLDWLDISHLADRPFQGLSTGEARKILLARALVYQPQILLLDEPFDGLDEASRDFLTARFTELITQGTHFIFVSHHEADFPPFLTHEMHIENGRITKINHR